MRYTLTARVLHWLTALAILVVICLGLIIGFAEPEDEALKLRLYNIHESIGISLIPVTLFRLYWRWGHPPPPLPSTLTPPMRFLAHANHAAIYLVLLVQPLVGLAATNAWGFPLTAFGLVPIPSPVGPNDALAPTLSAFHGWIALTLGALLVLHIGAALMHHFIWRDDGLRRIL
ncbi:cytochrome b [Acetobacteraceae bacterium H6797]|nr:cytochrome b [Acetobacteraceae bacterium H6797]